MIVVKIEKMTLASFWESLIEYDKIKKDSVLCDAYGTGDDI